MKLEWILRMHSFDYETSEFLLNDSLWEKKKRGRKSIIKILIRSFETACIQALCMYTYTWKIIIRVYVSLRTHVYVHSHNTNLRGSKCVDTENSDCVLGSHPRTRIPAPDLKFMVHQVTRRDIAQPKGNYRGSSRGA